jgi:hypothetical protein
MDTKASGEDGRDYADKVILKDSEEQAFYRDTCSQES